MDVEDQLERNVLKGEKENLWVVLAALLDMVAAIFHAFHEFFTNMSMTAASRYMYEINQRRFFEEASKDIEAITNATSAESSSGFGTRRPFEED